MLKDKKRISGKNLGQLNVTNKVFFSVSLCPYYRLIWGKFKDLPRQGKVHHVFCLGGIFILYINYCIMETQLNSIILVTFLTSFWTRILKINFCKYSICSVYIVKALSFCRCEAIFIIFPRKLILTSLLPTPLLFNGLLPRTAFTNPVFTSFCFIDCSRFILIPRWFPTKRFDASNFKKSVAS